MSQSSPATAADRDLYDVIVVGAGPAGSTAAHDLAKAGRSVLLLDRGGRVKPCGGAVPPQLLRDFDVPESLLVAHIDTARIISPTWRTVDIPVGNGFVGMVDREVFDEWLRVRRAQVEGTHYAGDAIPSVRVDLGPVVTAAFVGAPLPAAEPARWPTCALRSTTAAPRRPRPAACSYSRVRTVPC